MDTTPTTPTSSPETDELSKIVADIVGDQPSTPAETAEDRITKLGLLLETEARFQWDIGDLLIVLIDSDHLKLKDLAARFNRDEATLSQYYTTARDIGPSLRRYDLPFHRHMITASAIRRVEKKTLKDTGTNITIDPAEALDLVIHDGLKSKEKIVRKLRDQVKAKMRPQESSDAANDSALLPANLLNTPHHADYRDVLPRLPDACIQIAHLDPPYSDYMHETGFKGGAAGLSTCDNDTPKAAVKVTCDAFPLLARKLAQGGVILLWQNARAMRPAIYKAAEDAGFYCRMVFVWDKKRPQPGDMEFPWTQVCEFCYIFHRVGETLLNYDSSDRRNIRYFKPVQFDSASMDDNHGYQKPEDLCAFLIGKHSIEGHIVADLFGCSGVFCAQAHKMGRKWFYCESHQDNFNLGAERLKECCEDLSAQISATAAEGFTPKAAPAVEDDNGAEEVEVDPEPEPEPAKTARRKTKKS